MHFQKYRQNNLFNFFLVLWYEWVSNAERGAQGQCCVRYLLSTRVMLVDAPRCSQQDISSLAVETEKIFENLLLAIFSLHLLNGRITFSLKVTFYVSWGMSFPVQKAVMVPDENETTCLCLLSSDANLLCQMNKHQPQGDSSAPTSPFLGCEGKKKRKRFLCEMSD